MSDPIFGQILEEVTAEMHPFASKIADAEQVRCALALARQKRIAAAENRIRRGFIDGLGEVVARIDADVWHRLAVIYGYETMRDPEFLRCLIRDSPEIRVRSVSRKTGICVPVDYKAGADACTIARAEEVDTTPAELGEEEFQRTLTEEAA